MGFAWVGWQLAVNSYPVACALGLAWRMLRVGFRLLRCFAPRNDNWWVAVDPDVRRDRLIEV